MTTSISSFNWSPSYFQNMNQTNLYGVSNVDQYVGQNMLEQSLNLNTQGSTAQPNLSGITGIDSYVQENTEAQKLNLNTQLSSNAANTYDLLNNISNSYPLYGITNLNNFVQYPYLDQALQSYNTNQNYMNYSDNLLDLSI